MTMCISRDDTKPINCIQTYDPTPKKKKPIINVPNKTLKIVLILVSSCFLLF